MAMDELRRKMAKDKRKYGNRLPPGQKLTSGWPVLTYGPVPAVSESTWKLTISGLVDQQRTLDWQQFKSLPQVTTTSDIHCVTHWSTFDNEWQGVRFADLMALAQPRPQARFAMVHSYGGYSTNLSLDDLQRESVLLAHSHNGEPLSPEHGGPLRLVVPHLYYWKSAKWVRGIVFMAEDRPGFWETHGYHLYGDPWKEERYS